ncbi:DoxX family protein [Adhaeribacter swui]|uniref:DoxX family protein n=1 Tax=Adhaeribacter swui TaxID=2086471 RepID=A0A7G7GBJ0_9BACT|nr:DoxX family protein [Adhaeribacter swui]QNF34524.1 DoxX family protein [Adhaeribacter swui]
MEVTHKIEHWADQHHPIWLDFIRFGLGIFLFVKGLIFISDIGVLERLLININMDWSSFWFAHYIAFAHLVGGLLITMGLVTRTAILFQLPILIGAVLFVRPGIDFGSINTEWGVSVLTLFLLVVFFIFDSGRWSIDQYMRTHRES